VPTGSGNDFARALGLRGVRDSLTAWQRFITGTGNVRQIDLGVISSASAGEASIPQVSRYFCCVAGVGLDSEVARRANRLPRWLRGNGGYVLALAPTIFTFAPFVMKILSQGTPADDWSLRSDQPTLLAAFANTSTYGDGMRIAPQARMDDGLLDVCIVGAVNALKLFCMFPTVYGGKHLSIREVEYFQSPRVRVETEHPLDVYADGECVCQTPVEGSIEPAVFKVVVP
jgi:diacylglycerol kinase (ATP)